MKPLSVAISAAVLGAALVVGFGPAASNAATVSCHTAVGGTDTREYQLDGGWTQCAYGTGSLGTVSATGHAAIVGTVGGYSPSTVGVYPIPSGATSLGSGISPLTNTYVTSTGLTVGTITFSSLYNFSNVYIGIQDGGVPRWSVFYLASIAGGTILNWDYLTCGSLAQPSACVPASATTGAELFFWGTATLINQVGTTPLPGALPLFATGLGALGLLGWRKKRKKVSAFAAA